MAREQPFMMLEMLKAILKQQGDDHQWQSTSAAPPCEADWFEQAQSICTSKSTAKSSTATKSTTPGGQRGPRFCHVQSSLLACPDELQTRLQGLLSAQALEMEGFYEPIDPGDEELTLPKLPPFLSIDLEIAFETFATSEEGPVTVIPPEKLHDALMYVGAFNFHLPQSILQGPPLNLNEFLALANEAVLAKLTVKQMARITAVFAEYDLDGNGMMEPVELEMAWKEITKNPNISVQEIECISSAWTRASSNTGVAIPIDLKAFVGIMSRFIRKHQHDYNMSKAFRDVLSHAGQDAAEQRVLTAEALTRNPYIRITMEEAEEMIWAAGWRQTQHPIMDIEYAELVSAVLLRLEKTNGRLPPPPKMPAQWNETGTTPCGIDKIRMEAARSLGQAAASTQEAASQEVGLTCVEHLMEEVSSPLEEPLAGGASPTRQSQGRMASNATAMSRESGRQASSQSPMWQGSPSTEPVEDLTVEQDVGWASIVPVGMVMNPDGDGMVMSPAGDQPKLSLKRVGSSGSDDSRELVALDVDAVKPFGNQDQFEEEADRPERRPSVKNSMETWISYRSAPSSAATVRPARSSTIIIAGKTPSRVRLHLLLEDPSSSKAANIFSMIIGAMICVSVMTMVLQPLVEAISESNGRAESEEEKMVWRVFEVFFTVVFTLEYLLRLSVADALGTQTVWEFTRSPSNICDIVAVSPFYIEEALTFVAREMRLLRVVRLTRLIRIVRIMRLARMARIARAGKKTGLGSACGRGACGDLGDILEART
jgi:hypothetical protein